MPNNTELNQYKQQLSSWANTILELSERNSYTPTKEAYTKQLQSLAKELTTDTNTITTLNNYISATLSGLYDKSLQEHPRTVSFSQNTLTVTDEWIDATTSKMKSIQDKLQTDVKTLLEQSEKTGNTPTKEQFQNYINGRLSTYLNEDKTLTEHEKDYIKNYSEPWLKQYSENKYDTSLKKHPRTVNGILSNSSSANNAINSNNKNNSTTGTSSSNKHRSVASNYSRTYTTFSGYDMVCVFEIPVTGGYLSEVVGSLQTVTYSVHQEKFPVRNVGNMNAKGYVFGPRTIAGTLIFTVFNKHWAHDLMDKYLNTYNVNAHFLVDEFPPINITVSCTNEYGNKARLALHGVTFVNEGQVMSINDNYTENTFQFFATDVDYLDDVVSSKVSDSSNKTNSSLPTLSGDATSSTQNQVSAPSRDVNVGEKNNTSDITEESYNLTTRFQEFEKEVQDMMKTYKNEIPKIRASTFRNKLRQLKKTATDNVNNDFKGKKITKQQKDDRLASISTEYKRLLELIEDNTLK